MTREDIEKASKDYQNTLPYCDDRKVRGYFVGAKDGFIKGAEWRINSVWHPITQPPERNKIYVAQIGKDAFETFYDSGNWKSFSKGLNFARWAYIKDLIPNEEG